MGKRLLVIGVLSLCLVGVSGANVDAACSVQYGKLVCKSVCPEAGGVGAGNVDKNPVALCSSLAVTEVDAHNCWNPAWNSATASGNPFDLLYSPSTNGVVLLTKANLAGDRGQWEVTADDFEQAGLCWTWEEIWGGITAKLCPNDQWHLTRTDDREDWGCDTTGIPPTALLLDPGNVCKPLVLDMYAYFATYQQKQGKWVPAGSYCAECTFDPNPLNACYDAGNPIICSQVATSKCADTNLVTQCDNAVLNPM